MRNKILLVQIVLVVSWSILLFNISVEITFAEWPSDPTVNVPICTEAGDQLSPQLVSDGSGGAIIMWVDHSETGLGIYAQRVDASGTILWTTNGVPISPSGEPQYTIVSDGSGGAIITWLGFGSETFFDIYAQRVDASGTVKWAADGVPICTASDAQFNFQIVSDGSGGAIITWEDYRSGNSDIYAQHVNGSGAVLWATDGVPICTAASSQWLHPQIVSDGAGGAIITWEDFRSGSWDIYAQRVDANGTVLWTTDGVLICTAEGDQWSPQIVSDGAGGAIITWWDWRSGNPDIYAQRVDASGSVLWTTDGVPICTAAGDPRNPQLVSDDAGGAIITWVDWRSGKPDIYGQRVNESGEVLWTTDGVHICMAVNLEGYFGLISDSAGGAIITWYDGRSGNWDIYAQRVDASGAVLWATDGVPICTAADGQCFPQLTSDGAGGAIITWQDGRGGDNDIYAQNVQEDGSLGVWQPYDPEPIQLVENGSAYADYLNAGYYQKYKFTLTADGRQYTITATPTSDDVDLYYRNLDPNISPFVPGSYDASSRHPGMSVEQLSFIAPSDGVDYTVYPAVLAVTDSLYTIRVTSGEPGGLMLQSPADGSHITASPTFEWSQVPNAIYYELVLAEDADFAQPIWNRPAIDGSETSVVYSGSAVLEANQTYYWRMRFQDTDQIWSDWTDAFSFVKDAPEEQLPAPSLSAPADCADVALPEKFSWQTVPDAVRYIVQVVAQTSEVLETSEVYNVLWSGQSSTNSIIVPQTSEVLKTSEVYQWRAAGIDSDGNIGDYSDGYSFTFVETTSPPAKPTPISPASGETIDTQEITFSWTSSPAATAYNLRYSIEPDFPKSSAKTWAVSDITATNHTVTLALASATTIYWQASAKNSGGDSGWTDAISFNYAPPVTSEVTSVKIDMPKDGQPFIKDSSLGAHAYMTGTYEGEIIGAWYLDDEHHADFTANMIPSEGAEIDITGLPTSEIKSHTIQVRLTSPNEISSNAVTYQVYDEQVGEAAILRMWASPEAIRIKSDTIEIPDILDVPYFSQLDPAWKDRALGNNPCGNGFTIGSHGCVITSVAMILNYYVPNYTTPLRYNNWLKTHGFDPGDGEYPWNKTSEYTNGVVTGDSPNDNVDWATIDNELSSGRPVVVKVNYASGHYIVITGKKDEKYYINDPLDEYRTTLDYYTDQGYNVVRMVLYDGPSPGTASTIVADVFDVNGNMLSEVEDGCRVKSDGDTDREISFSVSGEGVLSSTTALTLNGRATVILQSTELTDPNVVVTATADGLDSDSVSVRTYTDEKSVEPYLTNVRTSASILDDIGYDISGVNDFLSTQIEVPEPTPDAIESLKRLELMLDLMVKAYYGTAGDLTGGTKILLNDFSENIGSVIALAVTYPIVIKALLAKIAHDVGLSFLVEYIEALVESASTKCIDFVADLTRNIVDLVGSGPTAYAVQEFVDIASLAAKEFIIEEMTGEFDPVEAAKLLIEKIVQAGGPLLAQIIYVHYTQPVLNQAVSLAESNTYGGTYESCKNSVEIALVGIRTESEIIHNDVEANSLKMQTLPMIQELLLTWKLRAEISILDFAKNTGAAILSFLDLRKWYYSINSSAEALIVVRRISNERIPNSISGAFGVEVTPVHAAPSLAQTIPDARFYRSLMRRMESSAANYDNVVREILFALENNNLDSVLEMIDFLLDADAQLSSDMAIIAAPIGAATTNALKTIPNFDERYDASSFAKSDATAQQTIFLNALMNYLIDPEDDALRQSAIDRGYAALQANVTASDEIVQTVTGLFTTPAYPYLLATSVEFSADELKLHDTFTITAKIMNAGAGMAHNVKVELSVDESIELLSVATIDIGDLDNGIERTVSWELEVVSNTGHVSFANLKPTSDDAISVAKIVPIYLNRTNYGDVSGDSTISALDAAMILQHVVGLIMLSDEAQALADVSNNGEISAFDASLILQRVVGLIDKFPIENGTTASPSQYVRFAHQRLRLMGQPYRISLANAQAKPTEHVIIPLTFGGAGVLCGEFTVEFDADVLEFVKKNEKPSFSEKLGFLYPLHTVIGNKINFAFANAEPNKPQSSNIVDLEFSVLRNAAIGETKLHITAAKINESMNITAIDGAVNILLLHTALHQNYPNPFNPETWIPYQLADAADVTVEIYGITGNLIKSINLGRKAAGAYMTKKKAICWDGRNEVGEKVASGVYFYTLRASKFRATRRMVIVK